VNTDLLSGDGGDGVGNGGGDGGGDGGDGDGGGVKPSEESRVVREGRRIC